MTLNNPPSSSSSHQGFLTNWEIEKEIWDRIFSKDVLQCEPEECGLVVTEPCFNLPNIQQTYDQIVFEEYEFESYYRTTDETTPFKSITSPFVPAPQLCLHNDIPSLFGDPKTHPPDCVVIVDSGYSFTHIVPFLKGKPVAKAIRRLNQRWRQVADEPSERSRVLPVRRSRIVYPSHVFVQSSFSFPLFPLFTHEAIPSRYRHVLCRHYNMMDETYLMNEVKEACCYVSQDVFKDLDLCNETSFLMMVIGIVGKARKTTQSYKNTFCRISQVTKGVTLRPAQPANPPSRQTFFQPRVTSRFY
ncbi:hypothetical protein BC938DRAFT_483006 [Jimgerdemannia flammicorona]|uniref:Actin family n=1 Tax=Jimgerdemannia flammicorona TaxID=994334 RepID=A0A433R096_9FUNG|nr:hypothetical protein BC938DRAFT_483006 [Jimgerdemannia flammicorona]